MSNVDCTHIFDDESDCIRCGADMFAVAIADAAPGDDPDRRPAAAPGEQKIHAFDDRRRNETMRL